MVTKFSSKINVHKKMFVASDAISQGDDFMKKF